MEPTRNYRAYILDPDDISLIARTPRPVTTTTQLLMRAS